MAEIAAAAGVSRQTLYKEFGSRDEFAQALVDPRGRALPRCSRHGRACTPRRSPAAVGAALETFLRTAGEDPLVRILLSDDGTAGLLPFVATEGMPVVHWATARLTATIEQGWPQAPPPKARLLAEALVRLAISRMTAPGDSPETIAAQAGELLGPFIDEALGRK